MNLPLTVASRAAKTFQDREDARLKEKFGTASDPASIGIARDVAGPREGALAVEMTMDAAAVLATMKARNIAFVDVREDAPFAAGHIAGATSMPLSTVGVRVSELPWDQVVVAYCDDGKKSAQAVAFFRERGMEDTYLLTGGIAAWRAAGGGMSR